VVVDARSLVHEQINERVTLALAQPITDRLRDARPGRGAKLGLGGAADRGGIDGHHGVVLGPGADSLGLNPQTRSETESGVEGLDWLKSLEVELRDRLGGLKGQERGKVPARGLGERLERQFLVELVL
jgi:hypothetical protein